MSLFGLAYSASLESAKSGKEAESLGNSGAAEQDLC